MISYIAGLALLHGGLPSRPFSDTLRLEFQNRLGVRTAIAVASTNTGNDLLDEAGGRSYGPPNASNYLVLRADSVYYLIPWGVFRGATLEGTAQVVTLADGTLLRGRLLTVAQAAGPDPKTYDLSSATQISISAVEPSKQVKTPPSDAWTLTLPGASDPPLSIRGPAFAIQYYSTSGYSMGGSERERIIRPFKVMLGADTVLANPGDFTSIVHWARGRQDSVEVQAAGGTPTRGELLLSERDDRGEHGASSWFLLGDMLNGVRVAVVGKRSWRLARVP